MRDLLVRGMLAGIVGAVLSAGFAYVVGEPEVSRAIAYEERQAPDHAGGGGSGFVSRSIQSTIGLGVGLTMLGVAFGGLFAVAFAAADGRLGALGQRGVALTVALAGFVGVYLVPFLKYPPNPPAVGDPETIATRTVLYFGVLVISTAAAVGALILQRRLTADLSSWTASMIAGAAFALVIAGAMLALPGVNEVPSDFPAVTLWRFRLASLGTQFVWWLSIGLVFGALTERAERLRARQALGVARDMVR